MLLEFAKRERNLSRHENCGSTAAVMARSADDSAAAFLGVPLHLLTMEQTLSRIVAAIQEGRTIRQVSLNVAKLIMLRRDAELAADVVEADIVSADGMGIVIGARLLGIDVPERVAGVDLMEKLLARCSELGFRPYLLGAREGVLDRAIGELAARHPSLHLAGAHHGYYTPAEETAVVAEIIAARPDCLFVGMPTPRKERFMARHHAALGIPFVMGVGGGLDVLAGVVARAPVAWQRTGLEWLYRTLQEPRRMWRRYLTTNLAYAWVLSGAVMRRAIGLDNSARRLSAAAGDVGWQ
jgi:N-acetylglucosaminyldiphosphoundecaprenol N-acetyl-beta-D-mannosaminyltransferase